MKRDQGNVLFLILIAVALFAALTYAVTKSSRDSGTGPQKEIDQTRIAGMVQYAASLKVAATRMVLNGKDPSTILVRGTNTWDPCSDGSANCLFGPKGGGAIEEKLASNDKMDIYGNYWTYLDARDNVAVKNIGTDAVDLIVQRFFKLDATGLAVCTAINKSLGIAGVPIQDNSNNVVGFYMATPGQPAACFRNYSDFYVFYYVLAPR